MGRLIHPGFDSGTTCELIWNRILPLEFELE